MRGERAERGAEMLGGGDGKDRVAVGKVSHAG